MCVSVPYGPQSRHTKARCLDTIDEGVFQEWNSSNNVKAEKQASVSQSS